MDILNQLLLQLILILFNAFFAATEIAVISLNKEKVKARAESGEKKAVKMLRMIEQPTGFLSTIQIGITLAGFLGSAFAADNFAESLGTSMIETFSIGEEYAGAINTVAVVLITLILSYFTLVLGELVPKRIAMKHKEKYAELVVDVITGLATILRPVIWFLTVSTNGVLRLFGINPNEKEEAVSEEDIVIMLDAGADEGTLDEDDVEYIKNVFKLDNMTAADVMTSRKNMVSITEDATEEEILHVIEEEGYSRIPVYSENHDSIVGILYTRDYLLNFRREGFKLEDAMFAPVYVPESMHLDNLIKDMQTDHNHIVMVVNEFGVLAGIVTMEDILEEIVGEIWDESDDEITEITKNPDNSFTVLSGTSTEDFFEFFDVPVDEETEATTVNGWLIEKCEAIPEVGYSFDYDKLTITVAEADEVMTHSVTVRVNELEEEMEARED